MKRRLIVVTSGLVALACGCATLLGDFSVGDSAPSPDASIDSPFDSPMLRPDGGDGAVVSPDAPQDVNRQDAPVVVPPLPTDPVAIAAGYRHACALLRDHRVFCWGAHDKLQLGRHGPDAGVTSVPTEVPFDQTIPNNITPPVVPVYLQASTDYSCIEDDQRRFFCWGSNIFDHLGFGDTGPAPVATPANVVSTCGTTCPPLIGVNPPAGLALMSFGGHGCAVDTNSQIDCWGYNNLGQLGYGYPSQTASATAGLANPNRGRSIAAGGFHTCAVVDAAGSVHASCWGDNSQGQLGVGGAATGSTASPVLPGAVAPQAVAAGTTHSCALGADGHIYCWGGDAFGEVGVSSGASQPTPVLDLDFASDTVTTLAAGSHSTCAIVSSGALYCFGDNRFGQLAATADSNVHASRVKIDGFDDTRAVSIGFDFMCALRAGGGPKGGPSVWCWGANGTLQLGEADAGGAYSHTPARVPLPLQ